MLIKRAEDQSKWKVLDPSVAGLKIRWGSSSEFCYRDNYREVIRHFRCQIFLLFSWIKVCLEEVLCKYWVCSEAKIHAFP